MFLGLKLCISLFKQARDLKVIPNDVAKTSLPQEWHQPRGDRICPKPIDDVTVYGMTSAKRTRGISSTLFNPCSEIPDHNILLKSLSSIALTQVSTAVPPTSEKAPVKTKFGYFPFGSTLAHQQQESSLIIQNIYDAPSFPHLPDKDFMYQNYNFPLTYAQTLLLHDITVNKQQAHELQEATQMQSESQLWSKLRSKRLTASKAGEIFKYTKGMFFQMWI